MAFPQLSTRHRSLTVLDLMVLGAVSTLPMAGIVLERDAESIVDRAGVAGIALFLLVVGQILWWLSGAGVSDRTRWLSAVALPAFMGLAALYLIVAVMSLIIAPHVAVLVVGAQVVSLCYLVFRP